VRRLVVAIALLTALAAGGIAATSASSKAKKIKPKAGGYAGVITDKDGKGKISMVYATFVIGNKDRKAMQLFNWTGILKCSDGSTRDVTGNITSPLKGTRFSGKQTSGGQTLTFSGKWTSNTRVAGTIRMKTTAPKCDTGAITFKVKHT
jgi:hypothetical protein